VSALAERAEEYLRVRRALGHKMAEAARLLPRFVAYLDAAAAGTVSVELALAWATEVAGGGPPSTVWGRRMTVARGFARHLAALDPDTGVPPAGLLAPPSGHRAVPYLYSSGDIAALMAGARALASPLRAATHETVIGLLAVTGMRISEAIRLDRGDLDWDEGALVVRDSKFGKSRLLPVRADTLGALADYARRRDCLCPVASTPAFFVTAVGTTTTCWMCSTTCSPGQVSKPSGAGTDRGCMTSDTALPYRHCSTGMDRTSTSSPACRGCRPTSATSARHRRTGTCAPRPS